MTPDELKDKYPNGIPLQEVTGEILRVLIEGNTCKDHLHGFPQGPNEDMGGFCMKSGQGIRTMRPDGETFGDHLPDCLLSIKHPGYCEGGGKGHTSARTIRG